MTKTINCAVCGKEKLITNPGGYQFKRRADTEKHRVVYFCGYNCFEKYNKEHPYTKRMTEREKGDG